MTYLSSPVSHAHVLSASGEPSKPGPPGAVFPAIWDCDSVPPAGMIAARDQSLSLQCANISYMVIVVDLFRDDIVLARTSLT